MNIIKSLLIAGLVVFFSACAGNKSELKSSDVPEAVLNAFQAEHPDVKDIDWEKEGNYFEAGYEDGKLDKSVVYDVNGKVMETETEIVLTDLPPSISEYLNANYNGYEIEEAEMFSNADGNFYSVDVEKNEVETELIFDQFGRFIEIEAENGDEGTDED